MTMSTTSSAPLALPAGPTPAPRRQVLVGTVLAAAAGSMLIFGELAMWMKMRDRAHDNGVAWMPKGSSISMVTANTMLLAFIPACLFAQWAIYSAKRADRTHLLQGIGLTGLMGVAIVNAQAFLYSQAGVAAKGTAYNSLFYAVTGTFVVLTIVGIGFSLVTLFRVLGSRNGAAELVTAHALYWYFLAAAYCAVWFVVYVTK